jgi:hypothetical protein
MSITRSERDTTTDAEALALLDSLHATIAASDLPKGRDLGVALVATGLSHLRQHGLSQGAVRQLIATLFEGLDAEWGS